MTRTTWLPRLPALAAAGACTLPLLITQAALADTAPVVTSTTTNDAVTAGESGSFAYKGTWRTSTGAPAKYLGDDHYSSTRGSSYTFRFTGTALRLHGAKAPHHGHATVSVDGGAPVTVDSYAASRQDGALLYTSPTLAAGDHVIKVTVKGTKRSAATGTAIAIDRAVADRPVTDTVTSTVNDAVTAGESGSFAYNGTWRTSTGAPAKYLGDDHYSSTRGSSYTFRFTGTALRLHGAKAPHHGHATVSVDGGAPVTVDSYAASRQDGALLYTSPTLAAGDHMVKVTVKGTKRSAATGTAIAIDNAVTFGPASSATVTSPSPATATPSPVPTPTTVAPEPSQLTAPAPAPSLTTPAPTAFALDEQWESSNTITTTTKPWAKEWSGLADSPVAGGELKIPGSGSYHRVYYTERRFGGPGKPIVIRMRKRATNLPTWSGSGTIPSAAIWFRVPKDGVDKDDWRNAVSNNDPSVAGVSSSIVRDGTGTNGRIEVMAYDGLAGKYVTTGSNYSAKNVGYTAGTERDVTIRGDWVSTDRWRWRVWHTAGHDMSQPPVHDWTGYAPHQNDKGFFAFRTDFLDAHYKYVTLEELTG